jgi:2-methylcitrate dehydratase PrpD
VAAPTPGHRTALLDWLACAAGGREQRAARAARALGDGLGERIAAAGTAGHVLDYDDTYLPGLAHLSAPVAPVAVLLGAERGATAGEALAAFAAGFEFAGRLTAANHPRLRAPGWHPTAVAGAPAAALTAALLLGLDEERTAHALRFALLQASGLRAAFGSDGKSLQVGRAAAAGLAAARLAEAGATASAEIERGEAGFEQAYGARWVEPGPNDPPAASENWIKAYPCCLQTHGAIEAAAQAREAGLEPGAALTITVHPVSLHAASLGPDVADGLQAKFSIPYLTAYSLLHGPPRLAAFDAVDEAARALAHRIELRTDDTLLESEAVLEAGGERAGHVEAALGSPARPMDEAALRAKLRELAGSRLDGALDDLGVPAAALAAAAGLP